MLGDATILDSTLSVAERHLLIAFAERLRESFGERLERVVVFGSRARGDAHEDSDIDLLVVVEGTEGDVLAAEKRAWELMLGLEAEVGVRPPISLLVLGAEHFRELRRRERRFAADVLAEGIAL